LDIKISLIQRLSAARLRSLISMKTEAAMVPSRANPISNGNRCKTLLMELTKVCREGNFIKGNLPKNTQTLINMNSI
jgi:hypothetical protein